MLDNNLNLADSADQSKDYKEPPPTDACDDVTDNVIVCKYIIIIVVLMLKYQSLNVQ